MKLTDAHRKLLLITAVLAAVAGAAVSGSNEHAADTRGSEASQPVAATIASTKPEVQQPLQLALEKLSRTAPAADGVDLFSAKSWYVPPPPPPVLKSSEVAKPVAPRLPFTYVGQIEDKEGLKVILMRGDEMVFAAPGASLDANYRLDQVTGDQLVFVYVPLGEKQIIVTGGK